MRWLALCVLFISIAAAAAATAAAWHEERENTTAVIVEWDLSDAFVESLLNAREVLSPDIPIVVFTGLLEWRQLNRRIDLPAGISAASELPQPRSREDYSKLLMSCAFWRATNATFVLIFQADSRFCAQSPFNVAMFVSMGYDYYGAPWQNPPASDLPVGNGGFSLRRRSAAEACCFERAHTRLGDYHPEDVNTVKCLMQKGFRVAPRDVAELFSSERDGVSVPPMGVHKPYDQNGSPANRRELARLCPESDMKHPHKRR